MNTRTGMLGFAAISRAYPAEPCLLRRNST